jgi:cardiolipin synthase
VPLHVPTAVIVLAVIALAVQGLTLFLAFFRPDLPYHVEGELPDPGSADFERLLTTLTDTGLHHGNRVEVLTNGGCFYESELNAIAAAGETINLEAYIFHRGQIGERFVKALAERARAGVRVNLTVDYIGSFSTTRGFFRDLTDAGGRVEWYHSLRPDVLLSINNRTHRELMIIDGKTAFIGGAGIADQWYRPMHKQPAWRDTVFRVEGPVVNSLQASFAENWLRVAGEVLTGPEYFAFEPSEHGSAGIVITSTPAAGSTRARILYQLLIAAARRRIYITTPYFLPDRSARRAMRRAAQERGVEIKILTPGRRSDHMLTRASARRLYGRVIKGGAEIYEYEPTMLHAKVMIVDDLWSVVGSTNFDHRSFELNDEVNLCMCDPRIAARLTEDFHRDLKHAREISYDEWRRNIVLRLSDWLAAPLEKQQ